jgi:hypothetical protein
MIPIWFLQSDKISHKSFSGRSIWEAVLDCFPFVFSQIHHDLSAAALPFPKASVNNVLWEGAQ